LSNVANVPRSIVKLALLYLQQLVDVVIASEAPSA
jgi:hypothetical protein